MTEICDSFILIHLPCLVEEIDNNNKKSLNEQNMMASALNGEIQISALCRNHLFYTSQEIFLLLFLIVIPYSLFREFAITTHTS